MNPQRTIPSTLRRPSRFPRAAEGVFLFASASDRAQAAHYGQQQPSPGFSQRRQLTVQALLIATSTAGLGAGQVFGRYFTL